MLSNFFNSSPIIPTIKASVQNAGAFTNGDVLFDWASFDIPRGPARLLGATISIRTNQVGQALGSGIALVFAKDDGTNTAPATMGTEHAAFGLSNFNRTDIIGFVDGSSGEISGSQGIQTAVAYQTTSVNQPGLVLESSPNSGSTTGTDRFYVGGLAAGSLILTSNVTVDGTPATNQNNLDTTASDDSPTTVFAAEDVIHDEDDRPMGTISSVTTNDIVMQSNLANAGVNSKKLYNINPIRIILHFEK